MSNVLYYLQLRCLCYVRNMDSILSSTLRYLLRSVMPFRDGLLQVLSASDVSALFYVTRLSLSKYERNTYLTPARDLYECQTLFDHLEKYGGKVQLIGCDVRKLMTRIHNPAEYWNEPKTQLPETLHIGLTLSPDTPERAKQLFSRIRTSARTRNANGAVNGCLLRLKVSHPCAIFFADVIATYTSVFNIHALENQLLNLVGYEERGVVVTYTTPLHSQSCAADRLTVDVDEIMLRDAGATPHKISLAVGDCANINMLMIDRDKDDIPVFTDLVYMRTCCITDEQLQGS